MSKVVKVEITLLSPAGDEWQWMGKLSEDDLHLLCEIADKLNDRVLAAPTNDTESMGGGAE